MAFDAKRMGKNIAEQIKMLIEYERSGGEAPGEKKLDFCDKVLDECLDELRKMILDNAGHEAKFLKGIRSGIEGYLVKNYDVGKIIKCLENVSKMKRCRENLVTKDFVGGIISELKKK